MLKVIMEQKQTKADKMKRSKELALPILAITPNYCEAARKIGCSTEQIYKWLKNEEFRAELEKLRSRIVDDAVGKLKSHVTKAVDTLALLMDDESSGVRRAACNDILNHVSKFIELKELETRLVKLESALK